MNNKVNYRQFIGTMAGRNVSTRFNQETVMFLFNRSGIAVLLALVVAGLPVLLQYV